jgi:hypothetical protein
MLSLYALRPLCAGHYVKCLYSVSPNFRHFSMEAAKSLIDQAVKTNPLVVFMKGSPEHPMVSVIFGF